MKALIYPGIVLVAAILIFAGFILYSMLTWYDPPQKLTLAENTKPDPINSDSTFSVLSWNIGYAGLGDDMDFFYDGGKKVRGSFGRTVTNLDSISHFLKQNSSKSFTLIQEIDLHSRRSYYLDELKTLTAETSYFSSIAPNYVVGFVPVPPASPMGQVNSGIMTLSKYLPTNSVRYGYPGKFDWPNRLFNLRRCMLVNRYPVSNGKELILINSHMSAFDDGSLKKMEMLYLKEFILIEYSLGNYVVVGGDWNQSPPNFPVTRFGENFQSESFLLSNIAEDFMPADWNWVFDPESPTNRYLNETYTPGHTFRCLIDMFLVSPNVEVLHNKTIDLNFRNSDHNPIEMNFRLIK